MSDLHTDAYRVTLLIGAEHSDGKLSPAQIRDAVNMHFSGDRSMVWDHPPEVEIASLEAPGTYPVEGDVPTWTVFGVYDDHGAEETYPDTDGEPQLQRWAESVAADDAEEAVRVVRLAMEEAGGDVIVAGCVRGRVEVVA